MAASRRRMLQLLAALGGSRGRDSLQASLVRSSVRFTRRRRCAICGAGNRDSHLLAKRVLELVADVRVLAQEHARIFAPLTEPLAAKRYPRAGFFQDALIHAEIDQVAFAR